MRLLTLLFLIPTLAFAQNSNWSKKYEPQKAFVENQGQFQLTDYDQPETEIHFVFPEQNQSTYFTSEGVVFEFIKKEKVKKSAEEKAWRTKRKQQGFTTEEFNAFERLGHRLVIERDFLSMQWLGANPNVEVISENKTPFYHSYTFKDDQETDVNVPNIPSFETLTYKNLYPNIDVVYEIHPKAGIKYSVIVHPGGNISDVQLKYSKNAELRTDGQVYTNTLFGDVIDHAPLTFYESNQNNIIESRYMLNNDIVSFHLDNYDQTQTIVIDPWTQTPSFATNWDCIWECETDAAGNAYIIGGVMPMQLLKYNAAGVLQWTYNTPYDTTSWLGTFATDDLGNSYVTLGSTAAIQMVNTAGVMVWNNPSPGGLFGSTEFWNISFNCDQTKLVIGGTGGTLPPLPYIYDVDMATGNVTSSVQVTGGALIPTQEVRAITACNNSKYYWLSHDSIGYVHQNFNACPSGSSSFHTDNGYSLGYKCEDWRYNNTGMEAIASYGNYIFTHRGNEVHKRDFNTAAIVATASIPGGVWNSGFGGNNVENSGIAIDDCGNVYVGSKTGVIKYDQNLTQLATYPTSFTVYDVEVSTAGDIIAAGSTGDSGSNTRSGGVQSFAASACGQLATTCCDATICQPNQLCDTDAPFNLSTPTSGGTFSGTGITDPVNGTFDPSVSGPGVFTVYYTIACGTDSTTITVSTCATLTLCLETNGDITVSGGTGPYTWAEGMSTTTCVSGLGNCAGLFSFTDPGPPTLTWSDFATGGATQTPPAGADSIQVTDNFGNVVSTFSASTLGPCTVTTCDLSITSGVATDESCAGAGDGQIDVTFTGTGTYDITIGATPYYSGVSAGTYNISPLADGSYTVTVTSTSDPSCTEDIVVVIAAGPASTNATITPAGPFCDNDAAVNLSAVDPGGTWSGTGITDPSLGTFDPAVAGVGTWTITYTISGSCGDTDTENIVVNASDDATFSYASGSYCLTDPNPTPTVSGTSGGTFTIDAGGTINPTTGEIDIAASGAGSYVVTYTTSGSCPDTQTFNVTLTSGADATITPVTAVCENDPAFNLSAIDPGGSWSGTGITDAVAGTFDPSVAGAGTHTITYTISGSCGDTDTETVTVNAQDDASFNYAAATYCLSDPDPFATVTGTGGGTFSIDAGGVINAANGQIDLAASGAGSYTVTYTTSGACPDSQTFGITISAAFDATITPAGPFCENDPAVNLSAVDPGGTWSGTGITDAALGTFDPAVAGAGTFTITYDIPGSCGDTDTETITVSAADDASFTYSAASFCESDPNPSATISGTPGGSFSISSGGTIDPSTGEIDLAASGAGSYTVTYTTSGTCPDSQTFSVTVTTCTAPTASFTVSDDLICQGDCITFTESSTGPPTAWLWTFPGGTPASANTQDPGLVCFDIPGTHDIQLITTNAFGSDTAIVTITVSPTPVVSAGPDENIIIGESVVLTATGTGGTYTWSDGTTLSCTVCPSTTASPTFTTGYLVTLVDSAGCIATDSVTVHVTYIEAVGVPNAFSPNGDGLNDILYINGAGFSEFTFQIYNRYGQLVFETTDQSIGWDGTSLDGKKLNPGTFAYVLDYSFIGTEGGLKTGNITLIK